MAEKTIVKRNLTLSVGDELERELVYDKDSLKSIRYLGMIDKNRFVLQFRPSEGDSFPVYYPKKIRKIKYSGRASEGKTEYNFFIKNVDEEQISFSRIERKCFGHYSPCYLD